MHAQKQCTSKQIYDHIDVASNLDQMFISSCSLLLVAIDIPVGENITFPDLCIPPFLVQRTSPDEFHIILKENGYAVTKIGVETPDCVNSCGSECQECREDICSFHMPESNNGSKYKCQSSRDTEVLRMIFSRKGRCIYCAIMVFVISYQYLFDFKL